MEIKSLLHVYKKFMEDEETFSPMAGTYHQVWRATGTISIPWGDGTK